MPQKTFNNLSPERQREIVNVALEEFSLNDYESASLSAIINRLGLAKGSFYRYFESKEELYCYLQSFCRHLFTPLSVQMLHAPEKEFSVLWQDLFMAFKTKEEEYPMIIRFWLKMAKDRPLSFEAKTETLRRKLDLLGDSLSDRGETDSRGEKPDEDVSMVVLYHLMALIEYICLKYRIPPDKPIFSVTEDQLKTEVRRFADLLLNGIRRRPE